MEKFNKWYLILLILLYISFLKVEDLESGSSLLHTRMSFHYFSETSFTICRITIFVKNK